MVSKLFELIVIMILVSIAAYIAASVIGTVLSGGIFVTVLFVVIGAAIVYYAVAGDRI